MRLSLLGRQPNGSNSSTNASGGDTRSKTSAGRTASRSRWHFGGAAATHRQLEVGAGFGLRLSLAQTPLMVSTEELRYVGLRMQRFADVAKPPDPPPPWRLGKSFWRHRRRTARSFCSLELRSLRCLQGLCFAFQFFATRFAAPMELKELLKDSFTASCSHKVFVEQGAREDGRGTEWDGKAHLVLRRGRQLFGLCLNHSEHTVCHVDSAPKLPFYGGPLLLWHPLQLHLCRMVHIIVRTIVASLFFGVIKARKA